MTRHRSNLLALMALLTLAACPPAGSSGGAGSATAYPASRTQSGQATFAAISSKKVVAAALDYPKADVETVQQVPMSLTAADGTGLVLTGLGAKAVVEGPLAFTELHLTFHNPEPRQREGRFTITLPPGAAISRFAMKLHTGWQEAEVVERQKARQVYEDFLHRKQDPALLEKKAGNEFRARIFPIPGNSDKEIIISYSQKLASASDPYRIYLKGLPKIKNLKIMAMVGRTAGVGGPTSSLGGSAVRMETVMVDKTDFAPDRDFEVSTSSKMDGLVNGNLAVLRVKPAVSGGQAAMGSLMVLVDTSSSRAAGFHAQVEQLGAVLTHLKQTYGEGLPLKLACFDQRVDLIFDGPLGQFGKQDLQNILARRPLGASDLHRALAWAHQTVTKGQRLLLVSDGIATAGKTGGADLRAAASALGPGVERLDVMLVGGIRDEETMGSLVRGTLSRDGALLDGQRSAAVIAGKLARETVSGIKVAVPGARWIWPSNLDGVQSGDEVLIFADYGDGKAPTDKPITVTLSGAINQQAKVAVAAIKRPLLHRAWVEARIAHLSRQKESGALDPDMGQAINKQIIELSTKHRVLSDLTALLVLETEQDYQRYGIARTALADILVVGATGVEVQQRGVKQDPQPIVRRPPPRQPRPVVNQRPRKTPSRPRPQAQPVRTAKPSRAPAARPDFDEDMVSGEGAPEAEAPAEASKSMMSESRPAPPPMRSRAKRSASRPARREERVAADQIQQPASEPPPSRPAPVAKEKQKGPPPLTGKIAKIMLMIEEGKVEQALIDALRWRAQEPGNVLALIALGEALEAYGNLELAARVYGSIIDLFPSRADMRRFAGQRLDALGKGGYELGADTYANAAKQRPDHASGHHFLGMALLRAGKADEALKALEAGINQRYRISRSGVIRILREGAGLAAAALIAAEPNRKAEVLERLSKVGAALADKPSLRFVMLWETDANDVDFHIRDGQGGHAYYSRRNLPSGGVLFADVTNGYGPECFAIPGKPKGYPYSVQIHYYSKGPMGYGMGTLQIIEHDGEGGVKFEDRPYVVMTDSAYLDLGEVKGAL